MKNLTIEKAYELCLLKWEYIVNNNGDDTGLLDAHPELEELKSECAYCELFMHSKDTFNSICGDCPLNYIHDINHDEMNCCSKGHVWKIWYDKRNKKTAKAVLDLIIKTKP